MADGFSKAKTAPKAFRDWRRDNPDSVDWRDIVGAAKEALREQLRKDQNGLCCYCYVVVAGGERDHVEHIEPRRASNVFEWTNLALSCEGGSSTKEPPHCDHAKGDRTLAVIHPYKNPVARHVALGSKGTLTISPHPEHPGIRHDVEEVLKLNQSRLAHKRRSTLEAIMRDLDGTVRQGAPWKARSLKEALADIDESYDYAPLLRGWLDRQIRSRP